jgi:hypothetical protein
LANGNSVVDFCTASLVPPYPFKVTTPELIWYLFLNKIDGIKYTTVH